MSLPRDLTIAEVAQHKGVSTKTVRRWIAAGLLPAHRVGPQLIRVKASDLDRVDRPIPAAG